jgi:amino acid transporter
MSDPTLAVPETAIERLPRRLGLWSTTAVLVGITIGSGIFRVPSVVATQVGSVGGAALVWLLGAAVTLMGALTLVALVTAFPSSGGIYVYLREGYGSLVAFLFGWIKLVVTGPAAVAAIALIFASYARAFAPLSDGQVKLLAGALILTLGAANIRSVDWSAGIQKASASAKVIALAFLAVLIFLFGSPGDGALFEPYSWSPASWGGFGLALIPVLWTYAGWVDLTYIAGEVRDPARTFPRAMLGGIGIIVLVYVLANAAYMYVLPTQAMAQSTLVASDAARRVFGGPGASLVAALVMLATLGALNGSILTSPRVFFSIAEDGFFFRAVAAVHPRYRTPHVAVTVYTVLGLAGVATSTFEQLAEIFVFGIWPFYGLAVGAVFFIARRRPDLIPLWRSFGYPVLPVAFILVAVAMLTNGVVRRPVESAISFGIILLGIPVYYVWRTMRARAPQPRAESAAASDRSAV